MTALDWGSFMYISKRCIKTPAAPGCCTRLHPMPCLVDAPHRAGRRLERLPQAQEGAPLRYVVPTPRSVAVTAPVPAPPAAGGSAPQPAAEKLAALGRSSGSGAQVTSVEPSQVRLRTCVRAGGPQVQPTAAVQCSAGRSSASLLAGVPRRIAPRTLTASAVLCCAELSRCSQCSALCWAH